MIKKIYAKLGTGMTLQSLRWAFTPRTYLLESQQQHTDSVPAVSTVAETRPLVRDYDEDDFIHLMGFFKVLGAVADRDSLFQRTFTSNLVRSLYGKKHVFQATLHEVLSTHIATTDYFATDYVHPELTVFCPSCDYHSATAQKDTKSGFYHVTCSQCGLDADRDTVHLSPSSLQPHQAQ